MWMLYYYCIVFVYKKCLHRPARFTTFAIHYDILFTVVFTSIEMKRILRTYNLKNELSKCDFYFIISFRITSMIGNLFLIIPIWRNYIWTKWLFFSYSDNFVIITMVVKGKVKSQVPSSITYLHRTAPISVTITLRPNKQKWKLPQGTSPLVIA